MREREINKPMRNSRQRAAILEVLKSTKSHPTADWIYEKVREKIPNISLGTVYRNLAVLKEMGKIMELKCGEKCSRYDGNPENHYHFICVNCGQVFDVEGVEVNKKIDQEVSEKNRWEVFHHCMEFYGLCSDCSEKNV